MKKLEKKIIKIAKECAKLRIENYKHYEEEDEIILPDFETTGLSVYPESLHFITELSKFEDEFDELDDEELDELQKLLDETYHDYIYNYYTRKYGEPDWVPENIAGNPDICNGYWRW